MLSDIISSETRLSSDFINRIAGSADHLYKRYTIPKKTGGERVIEHPARRLKIIQRWITRRILSQLPTHERSMAYGHGCSIRKNALHHANSNYFLKIDLINFFNSLTEGNVEDLLCKNIPNINPLLGREDISFMKRILCRNGRLTIGAPSSPALSNALMYEFDSFWFEKCTSLGITFTRYADDLSFSTNKPKILADFYRYFQEHLSNSENLNLRVNTDKTVFTSRKRRRSVTGLILTSDRSVSLGRDRKREIRSLLYKGLKGDLDLQTTLRTRGLIAFAKAAEPQFLQSLERKFGTDTISRFLHPPLPQA